MNKRITSFGFWLFSLRALNWRKYRWCLQVTNQMNSSNKFRWRLAAVSNHSEKPVFFQFFFISRKQKIKTKQDVSSISNEIYSKKRVFSWLSMLNIWRANAACVLPFFFVDYLVFFAQTQWIQQVNTCIFGLHMST